MPRSPKSIVRALSRRARGVLHGVRRFRVKQIRFFSGLGDSGDLLYGLARSMKPEVCVEIGSARGKSACSIGLALQENGRGKLFAIDPHRSTDWNDSRSVDTFDVMRRNLERLKLTGQVEILRMTSVEAAKGWTTPIDMLFIDGDHSYAGVKRDWEMFVPHVREFGVVIFHDTIWDVRPPADWARPDMGVPRFVDELRQDGYPVLTIEQDCGVSLVQPVRGGIALQH